MQKERAVFFVWLTFDLYPAVCRLFTPVLVDDLVRPLDLHGLFV